MTALQIVEYLNIVVLSMASGVTIYAVIILYMFRDQPKLKRKLLEDSDELEQLHKESDKSLHDVTETTIHTLQYRIARERRMCRELAKLYTKEIEYYTLKINKNLKGSLL